ncbi:MAG: hypothetical protein HXY44_05100 [Syntrophaceae bacterium]|nr:hypothetical protein [Syntrophaceae bacterium]
MSLQRIILSLNSNEVIRLTKILLDEEKEDAFLFLKEVIKPQVDQATRSQ